MPKRYFTKGQKVVCRIGNLKDSSTGKVTAKLVIGTVEELVPVDKRNVVYSVKAEDRQVYTELGVDLDYNHCIDLPKTKVYYKAMGITDELPEPLNPDAIEPKKSKIIVSIDDDMESDGEDEEGVLYSLNDEMEIDDDV